MSGGLYDDILRGLEENGKMQTVERDRLIMMALVDIGRNMAQLKTLEKRVENLEESSLIMLAKKYPKVTGAVFLFVAGLMISIIDHLELVPWLLRLVGIQVP